MSKIPGFFLSLNEIFFEFILNIFYEIYFIRDTFRIAYWIFLIIFDLLDLFEKRIVSLQRIRFSCSDVDVAV